MLKNTIKEKKGITLIALVVTIIVLLVLAGVSINMLTGQNGILKKTQEAKDKTAQAEKEEKSMLNDYETQISNYAGVNWNEAKANAKAPEEQKEERNDGVIGIGTDGKSVNMDWWEYTLVSGALGYCLNDKNSIEENYSSSDQITPGYVGGWSSER